MSRLAREPKQGFSRREFFERISQSFLIGGAAALYFDAAFAQQAPNTVAAINRTERLAAAPGEFFPSNFITAPDLLNPNGTAKVGYRVGGGILPEYQRNPKAWGPVRTQEFDFQGLPAQLFEKALVVESESGITTLPVLDILQGQGLGLWLDEYGFTLPNVPVWKAAIASGQFVPSEALIPTSPDRPNSGTFPTHSQYSNLALINYDPEFGFAAASPQLAEQFANFGKDTRINVHAVSSPQEIPAPSETNPEATHPRIQNISGGAAAHSEYLIQSAADPNALEFWIDLSQLHNPVISSEMLPKVAGSYAARLYSTIGEAMVRKAPGYKWDVFSTPIGSLISPEEMKAMSEYDQQMRSTVGILFPVVSTQQSF